MPRRTDWVDTILNLEVTVGAQTQTGLMTGLSTADTRGLTIIRTILQIEMFSNNIAGAFGVALMDLAIGITSQEAFAAGVVPDPRTSSDRPPRGWMWRTSKLVTQNGVGTSIVTTYAADVRGGRKVENGAVFMVADHTALLGAGFQVNVRGLCRMLTKLP